jgi:thioredoxin-like negative regulator of GroEL
VFRRLFSLAVLAISSIAQDSRAISSVKGTVIADESLAGNRLIVNLVESISHKQIARSYVGSDGSFEFRDVPPATYTVELGMAGGDPIRQQMVTLKSSGDQIEFRLPARANRPGGTVSVRELQHPFSAKSRKIFAAAEKASAEGDYLRAVGILRGALNDTPAAPYARMNIGVAYLKAGQAAAAVPELQEAARLLPGDAMIHTNLAYALVLTRQTDAAEAECRLALAADRNNSKARWIIGSILLSKGSHEEEAVEDLRLASRELPKAKVILAQFYERSGQKDAAVRELREFLPQASGADRATVEQWLTKLTTK